MELEFNVILRLDRATVVAMKLVFLDRFLKKFQISNFLNIPLWESSCSMRTDRRAVITKLTVAFRNFVKAPKKKESE